MSGWLAIVNAFSGGHAHASRTVANALEKIRPFIRETAFSQYPGHARRLAATADDYAGVVSVGGDGTLLEVLNGIDRSRQTVAILPTGRGNSLARDLGLHLLSSAIDALRYGEHSAIDVAEVVLIGGSGRHTCVTSASTVAVGYPLAATVLANRMRRLGRSCYAAAALAAAIRLKPIMIELAYDGRSPGEDAYRLDCQQYAPRCEFPPLSRGGLRRRPPRCDGDERGLRRANPAQSVGLVRVAFL